MVDDYSLEAESCALAGDGLDTTLDVEDVDWESDKDLEDRPPRPNP